MRCCSSAEGEVNDLLHLANGVRVLMPLLLLFAVFLLLRGHDQPGGGFVGGLVVAAAFALYSIAFGVMRRVVRCSSDP